MSELLHNVRLLDAANETIAALRATITQQAQELAESERKLVGLCHAHGTALIEIHDLKQQLAASQARCRELERGKPSDAIRDLLNSALREENEYGSWAQKEILDNFAQLQATLAAREAAYTEIERKFRDVCMAHGPALLEIHGLKKELITSQAQVTTLKEHINNLESTDHY